MSDAAISPLVARHAGPLRGSCRVPGDKSISHRALILGGLAVGRTRVTGLLEGEDVLRTAAAMRELGAALEREDGGAWLVKGMGVGGLAEPGNVLDMGNSGTGARLLMGVLAAHPFTSFFTGDASLRRRPMARVATPLTQFGARIVAREGGRLPLAMIGAESPVPIAYRLPVASAQVKSAVLLAGLNAPGETVVEEPNATRDHSERLLRHFGAIVTVEALNNGATRIRLKGQPELVGRDLVVPGDPSSAAFLAVAALIVPGSEVTIVGVGLNPLRAGLYDTLREMGADIDFADPRVEGGEPVADLVVRASRLKGVEVPAERAPRMIDEYPVLAIAAAFAEGPTLMHGLAELRVKESDRLAAISDGLAANGAQVEVAGDTLRVVGSAPPRGGGAIAARLDHRIAMAFLVLGLATERPVRIDDGATIATSFPDFAALVNGLGGAIAADAA